MSDRSGTCIIMIRLHSHALLCSCACMSVVFLSSSELSDVRTAAEDTACASRKVWFLVAMADADLRIAQVLCVCAGEQSQNRQTDRTRYFPSLATCGMRY